jgi:hypothetical protein
LGGGDAGGVPGFFRLDEREARIQDALRVAEEARRRREVADYLYRFVRRMVRLGDEPAHIREALNEVWAVEVGYDPEGLAAKFIAPHPPTPSPTQAESGVEKQLFFKPSPVSEAAERGLVPEFLHTALSQTL